MNKLINERSAFLRSHASDPVDWLPWGEEAFQTAVREDKPLFIHIGFFGSHAGRRMSREAFSSQGIARIINRDYVPVLADREEHPEVEAMYAASCTLINGSAGTPLNIFADSAGIPFLACAYIPVDNHGSTPGLRALLMALAERWKSDRATLDSICTQMKQKLAESTAADDTLPDAELIKAAAEQLEASYDSEYGGFGKGAKFPAPQLLLFLLRYSKLSGSKKAREIFDHTLQQMYRGGFYDHLGGGFFRSALDREWLRPQFEKPLRENALLAYVYTESWQSGHLAMHRTVAESTLDFILRELKSEHGGYYTSVDSECGGKDGSYYLFSCEDVNSVLGTEEGKHFSECYDITAEGNCSGRNIPNLLLNNRWNLVPEGYDDFREKLRLFREERYTPALDTLVTESACGLALMAFAKAAAVFNDPRYLAEAKELADFMTTVFTADGENHRCYVGGTAYGTAGLADLSFAGLGMLELYAACREPEYLLRAEALADCILSSLSNDAGYDEWSDDVLLPVRPSSIHDGETPSGACAAALLMRRLSLLCGNGGYMSAADEQEKYIAARAGSFPAGCAFGLLAVLDRVYEAKTVIYVSAGDSIPDTFTSLERIYAPDVQIILKTASNAEELADGSPMTAECSAAGYYASTLGGTPLQL